MPTLTPAQAKRRAYGQHFLRDKNLAREIAATTLELANENHCKAILEIGPGKGAITLPLIEILKVGNQESPSLTLVERDRELAAEWQASQDLGIPLRVVSADFLETDEKDWLSAAPLGVMSNLPYSVGTAILDRLARHPDRIAFMVLMFQKEVALRIRAESNTRDWGSLSVWIQNRWDVRKLFSAPPGAFSPPPKVDSEVVLLTPRKEPRIRFPETPENEARWEGLLKACFAHRRKMLRAALPRSGPLRNALEASGVDGTKRAEALNWEEWDLLFQALLRK